MNVLLYIPAMYYCELGFYLEIIQRHRSQNDEVYILRCNGDLKPICDVCKLAPFFADLNTSCEYCHEQFSQLLKFADFPKERVLYIDIDCSNFSFFDPSMSINDVYSVYYRNYDVGMAVVNTISCGFNVYHPIVKDFLVVYDEIGSISASLYNNVVKLIAEYEIQKVYMFNGRLAINRSVLRACEACKTEFVCLEYALKGSSFQEVYNSYPQNPAMVYYDYQMLKVDHNVAEGHSFYKAMRSNKAMNAHTKDFIVGQIPNNFDREKINIAIFLSTLTEVVALKEFDSELIPMFNSTLVVAAIAEAMLGNPDFHFYLRAHPNIASGNSSQQLKELSVLANMGYENLTIIWPSDCIDSYALLQNSDKVLSFGSTVGIEATYYGKPSILLGTAFYAWTDGVYKPKSFSDAISLICQKDLPPKSQTEALKFGMVMAERGTPFRYYNPDEVTFLGKKLYPVPFKVKVKSFVKKTLQHLVFKLIKDIIDDEKKMTAKLKEQENELKMLKACNSVTEKDLCLFRSAVSDYLSRNLS